MESKQKIIQNINPDTEKNQFIKDYIEKTQFQPQIQNGIKEFIEHHKKEIENTPIEYPVTETQINHVRLLLDKIRVAKIDSELCDSFVNDVQFIDLMDIESIKYNIRELNWFYELYVPYCKI
ncbi:hypothetical protein [Methanosphaera cuniculi]|uniref:Uncharacterized protein n=1 Tax=Methanosphaera cuniculi TaxID=1077256 RepID=A0A2A2HDS3_9EURY|nr:hypothetical protein [Methanosphaera cuniculi]PAV07547.1 hypothetical protein ASJ82_07675 [Methanosphaera cuniculi]PWL08136.1 hypothetical protein MSCUN_10670 [Methanosphaera cuniculi]